MNLRKIMLSALLLLGGISVMAQDRPIGGDKDAHGCLTAAGYTWSVIKKQCIRVFELSIKLDEVDPQGSSSTITGVVISKDKKKAEIFMAGESGSLLLVKNGKVWKKGAYTLVKNSDQSYSLLKNKKVIFKN